MAPTTKAVVKNSERKNIAFYSVVLAALLALLAWTGRNIVSEPNTRPNSFEDQPVLLATYSADTATATKLKILPAQQSKIRLAQSKVAPSKSEAQKAPTQPVRLPEVAYPEPSSQHHNGPAQQVLPQAEFRLQHLGADQLQARLEKILGKSLRTHQDVTGQWRTLNVGVAGDPPVAISMHTNSGDIHLAGSANQVRAWQRIIQMIDTSSDPAHSQDGSVPSVVTELVATGDDATVKIRQAVNALKNQGLANQSQQGDNHEQQNNPPADSLLGPVQIEFVEGTGILMLRGNPRDVARVMKIIDEIERLSRISEPRIEVHKLSHVNSEALARMLQELFNIETLSSVYGLPVIVPLGQPNAILVIGQPISVEKAVEILEKLDLPGKSLTHFEVFRLQHATATDAQTVIENLFAGAQADEAPTLQAKALVVADLRTNTLIVRAGPRDMNEVRALIDELDQSGSETVNEIRIFKLQNSVATDLAPVLNEALQGDTGTSQGSRSESAESLAPLLRLITIDPAGKEQLESGVLAGTRVTADPRANALVISAPADSMPLLEALIGQLDQPPGATAELKVFTIANGDAVSLAEMLQSLFGDPGQQESGSNENEALFQLRISVDERTNSIIVAGTAADLLVVEAVLLRLDSSDVRQRQSRVYRLKNAQAEDVAESLIQWQQSERDVQETAPGVASPYSQVEREVVVVPDPSSNSLIISSTPRYYDKVIQIIEQLDEQAPMVMIQVLIGEVRLGDADEFGVELGLQDSALFDRSLLENIDTTTSTVTTPSAGGVNTLTQQIIQSANLTPGFDFGNPNNGLGNSGSDTSLASAGSAAAQGISSFAVRRVSPDLGFSGMVLSASSNSISMLLRALQESRRLEVLSRPQIMTMDNQEGRVFVGEQVPYITSSNIEQSGFRSNNIELIEVGLVLQVVPRISPDGLVVMSVFANKSELGSVADGIPVSIAPNGDAINAPRIATTQAETTISAVSGQTVVLSGLLTKRDQALHRRVPLLADIPLLGDLFRFDSTRTVRTELLIILTPHIVRNRYDAERIKQIESARMSWCLADVVNLHGPAGLKSNHDFMGEAEAELVYPDYVPQAEEIETPNRAGDIDQLQPIPQIYPESTKTNQPPTVDQTP
jgi:general secretion pathway protein D